MLDMIFWMTSKILQDDFLKYEDDDEILKASYVIVSTRITAKRKNKKGNVMNLKANFFPDARTCSSCDDDYFQRRYFEQLDVLENKLLLGALIKASIKEGTNIIFICTHKERKLKYMKYLEQYMMLEFGYPMYEYRAFSLGIYDKVKYDKKKILKKIDKLSEKAQKKHESKLINDGSKSSIKQVMKRYKEMNKKELKNELKKRNLYTKGMDKETMLDTIEAFL